MSYLNKMYGRNKPVQTQSSSDKNPNRVAGGLRGQGADKFVMMSEDGSQQEIPTLAYVRSLEEQLKNLKSSYAVLERKLNRLDKSNEALYNRIDNYKK